MYNVWMEMLKPVHTYITISLTAFILHKSQIYRWVYSASAVFTFHFLVCTYIVLKSVQVISFYCLCLVGTYGLLSFFGTSVYACILHSNIARLKECNFFSTKEKEYIFYSTNAVTVSLYSLAFQLPFKRNIKNLVHWTVYFTVCYSVKG